MHTITDSNQKLLSVADITSEYGIGRTTIYQQLKTGAIPAIKLGRATRIWRTDVERWLADQPKYCRP